MTGRPRPSPVSPAALRQPTGQLPRRSPPRRDRQFGTTPLPGLGSWRAWPTFRRRPTSIVAMTRGGSAFRRDSRERESSCWRCLMIRHRQRHGRRARSASRSLRGSSPRSPAPQLRLLHDRRIPGTRANIDHLVVCPTGVYVIDVKHYQGKRPALRVELDGAASDRSPDIDGRDRKEAEASCYRQATLAGRPDIPIRGVVCFIDADWPLLGGVFKVQEVDVSSRGASRARR